MPMIRANKRKAMSESSGRAAKADRRRGGNARANGSLRRETENDSEGNESYDEDGIDSARLTSADKVTRR
jgi:hypothetical protein